MIQTNPLNSAQRSVLIVGPPPLPPEAENTPQMVKKAKKAAKEIRVLRRLAEAQKCDAIERMRKRAATGEQSKPYYRVFNTLLGAENKLESLTVRSPTSGEKPQLLEELDTLLRRLQGVSHSLRGPGRSHAVIPLHRFAGGLLESIDRLVALLGWQRPVSQSVTAIELPRPDRQAKSRPSRPEVPEVLLPTELLLQAHALLFPPERMFVVAGRRDRDNRVLLTAPFDVTGDGPETCAVHCKADPGKLRRALITMERTDSFLASWWHSHPGSGTEATSPSSTDNGQYKDWIKDYWKQLVCAIFTHDGVVRFWGDAITNGLLRLNLTGAGLKEEGNHVYRFC